MAWLLVVPVIVLSCLSSVIGSLPLPSVMFIAADTLAGQLTPVISGVIQSRPTVVNGGPITLDFFVDSASEVDRFNLGLRTATGKLCSEAFSFFCKWTLVRCLS